MGSSRAAETVWLIASVLGLYRTVSVSQPGPDPSDCRFFMEGDEPTWESVDRTNPTGNTQTAYVLVFFGWFVVFCPAVPMNSQETYGFKQRVALEQGGPLLLGRRRRRSAIVHSWLRWSWQNIERRSLKLASLPRAHTPLPFWTPRQLSNYFFG